MKLIQFLKSTVLVFLSTITFIKLIFLKNKTGLFFILNENENSIIDRRSKVYLDKININNSVNFVRSQGFILSLRAYFKYKNIIFYNHIFNLYEALGIVFKLKRVKILRLFQITIAGLIKKILIKNFHTIDDYRNIQMLSNICVLSEVDLYIYQHGRISKSLNYQNKLANLKFHTFFLWSNFFKKKLIEFNKEYNSKNLVIKRKFNQKIKLKKKVNKIKKVIFIHEDNIQLVKIKKIIKKLIIKKEYLVYFKFRPNNKLDDKIIYYLKQNNIKFFHRENIYELFKKFKFDILIAFNSSLLLECSFFNIFPVMIYEKNSILKDYIYEKVIFHTKIDNLNKFLKSVLKKKNMLRRIKKKIWN